MVMNPGLALSDEKMISFASTFLKETAAIWRFTLVKSNTAPTTWEQFRNDIFQEFVPSDHARRAREKLRKLKQTMTVAKYLSEFRNLVLTIPDVSDGEKYDKFVSGLKYQIRLEVMKGSVGTFEEAARVALNVDGAINAASGSTVTTRNIGTAPTPMEIGNVQADETASETQRAKDLRTNACFRCHKPHCRPYKCKARERRERERQVNNTEVSAATESIETDDALPKTDENQEN